MRLCRALLVLSLVGCATAPTKTARDPTPAVAAKPAPLPEPEPPTEPASDTPEVERGPVDLRDYGLDSTYRRPIAPPIAVSSDEAAVMDELAVIHARVGTNVHEELEIRFFEPIAVEVLMTRFGTFENHLIDSRDSEFQEYGSKAIVGQHYQVSVGVRSRQPSWGLAKDSVQVVYMQRSRR